MEYLYIALLLLCSAFCSGTEIAYTSLSKLKVKKEGEKQTPTEKMVSFIYNHYDFALSTVLVGNNLVNIGATSVATVLAVNLAVRMDGRITDQTASTITVVDMMGREVTLTEVPQRVVALSAGECEILYALGAEDTLVGRGTYCDYPAEILEIWE